MSRGSITSGLPANSKGGYQPHLDGLRALAVLTIVAFHARTTWFPGGYIGVDLFFVVSGYLITGILAREVDRTGRLDFGNFYRRRALRLLPALLTLALVVVPLLLLLPGTDNRSASLLGAGAAVLYLSSPLAASGWDLGWFLHTWSLSVEEYFYLVWPVAVVLVVRARNRIAVLAILTATAMAYRIAAGALTEWSMRRISYSLDTRTEQLLLGALLAMVLARRTLPVRQWQVAVCAAVLAAFVIAPPELSFPVYRAGGSTVVAILCALVLAGLHATPTGPLTRLLRARPLVWVGRRSYGIYLWNLPIVGIVALSPLSGGLQLVIKIGLTFLVPALSYRFVELPFLRRKARIEQPLREREDVGATGGLRSKQPEPS